MSLTKMDIVESIYEHLDIPKAECIGIVESLFNILKDDLEKGNHVMISGFGRWSVKVKGERRGRNPKTGEYLTIDARKVVTFRPSSVLKGALNSGD